MIATSNKTAITRQHRQLSRQRPPQFIDDRRKTLQTINFTLQLIRQRRGIEADINLLCNRERIADGGQITRATPAQCQTRQRPLQIRRFAQGTAQLNAARFISHKKGDRIMAAADRRYIRQRGRQPRCQQAGASSGHALINHTEQTTATLTTNCLHKLQIAAGGSVNLQTASGQLAARRQQGRARFNLCEQDIIKQRASCADLANAQATPGIGRGHAIKTQQPVPAIAGIKPHQRQCGDGNTGFIQHGADIVRLRQGIGQQQLTRAHAGQRVTQLAAGKSLNLKLAGGKVTTGQRQLPLTLRQNAGDEIVAAGIKQRIFRQRAGRNDTHHAPLNQRLAAALFSLFRCFGLLADGNAKARLDQARHISGMRMHRHAAHGNVLPLMLAPAGQRNIKRLTGRHCIVKKQLVKIAHAIEQQQPGMGLLDGQILGHHRGDFTALGGETFGAAHAACSSVAAGFSATFAAACTRRMANSSRNSGITKPTCE